MPTNEPRPTKAVRRDEARAKAAQMRKEQERKAKRTRLIGIAVLVLAVLALGFIVWKIVTEQNANESANSEVVYGGTAADVIPPALADVSAPAPAADNGGIPVSGNGADAVGDVGDGDVVLTIYFDFMCPVCGTFEQINGEDLDTLLADGGTTIEYHPISFLDSKSSGTSYSTRAANATAIVADKDPEHFAEFVSAMYVDQPAEGSAGRTDAEIAKIATDVGVPQDVADSFTDTVSGTFETGSADDPTSNEGTWRTFAPWVTAATAQMQTDIGEIGTPTVLIDGKKFTNWQTPGALLDAVNAAKS
ncbi:thioredoxin domain-containing protein [Cellulomonas sp. URHE0023]|uniref:DsbA family protein n=1 Tax=Cellulomonas sp. URHE0023 TaxID=1380354 RepID=UPI0004892140|nr:thioredoxin domain-containing protein [Cellulomonas sp. URHE0023]